MTTLDLDTPEGLARAHLSPRPDPRGALVLGHGAGGSVTAPDLQLARQIANERGLSVALVEQPYRVAGRRSAAPAPKLDRAWTSVLEQLPFGDVPVITGGRSSGARVACRTATATGAAGVLCLAFPLLSPPRRDGTVISRLPELEAVTVPVLVVQGVSDRFGMPDPAPNREVVQVEGDHGLKKDKAAIAEAIRRWLAQLVD